MWQTHSFDALHIQQLQLKIVDLEEQLSKTRQENSQALSESQQARIDALVVQYKQKIQNIEDEKIRVTTSSQDKNLQGHLNSVPCISLYNIGSVIN